MITATPAQLRYAVYHAFMDDGAGGTTHTDDPDQAAGWTAYVRTEPDEDGQFEMLEDVDVESKEDALIAAMHLAKKHGATIIKRD